MFDRAGVIESRQVPKEEIERLHQNDLMTLLNRCISRMIEKKGGRRMMDGKRHVYFFPAMRGRVNIMPFSIPSNSGKGVTVASPKFDRPMDDDIDGLRMAIRPNTVNHCFHKGLEARAVRLWDRYFVAIRDRKVYTRDGFIPLEGENAALLDAKYRGSMFNRGEAQVSLLNAFSFYIFQQWTRSSTMLDWIDQFKFERPLTIESDQCPIIVDVNQDMLGFDEGDEPDED